jgi:serine/threonine protein kinase
MDFNYDNIPKFLELPYNNNDVIIDSLCQIMVEHTKNLATIHCEKYTNTFIFFDGIPSMAKIKEQVVRRVFPVLIREIRTKIMKEIDDCVEKRIRNILLPDFPPTIGLDSIVVNKLRDELSKINDMKLGKFYINDVTDGEAEHQIMEYLENKNLIHRDLASRNILLFTKEQIKICDFGMTRSVENGLYTMKESHKIPAAW